MSSIAMTTRPPTPFKELDFFVEADTPMFAGRDRETRVLVSRIVRSRAVVVHARSGLGKTSLLRAGVIPVLIQQKFRPVYVRTLDSLLGDLADSVARDCALGPPPGDGDASARARWVIETASASGPVVLVLDQFEEFFTRFEHLPRERQSFVQFITDIVRDEKRDVRVVFSLREDYLYALDEFQRKLPDLFTQAFRLLPLTPLGAREAITRPLLKENVRYDEALITQLVDELTGFDFDSARLQVTCSEVYRHALAEGKALGKLNADDLNSLKESSSIGLHSIYKRYLRAAIANLPEELDLEAKLIIDKLISAKHTRFAIDRDTLHAELADPGRVDFVLTALAEQKLVRQEIRGGKEWFELRHECLIEELIEWFKEDVTFDSFRFVRGQIEVNALDGRFRTRPERLLPADGLAALLPLREHLRLTPAQFEYVLRSAIYAHSPEVLDWAKHQSSPETDALLRTLSKSDNAKTREGAIRAIGLIGSKASDLRQLCLQVAFDSKEPREVRAAAQKSAANVASTSELATLARKTRLGRTPPDMRELLADIYEAGRMTNHFSLLQRWLTVWHIVQRRSKQYAELRRRFVQRGILGGVFGAAVCAPQAVVILAVGHGGPWTEFLFVVLAVFGAAVLAGALIGWRNGAAAFRRCAMGVTRWRSAAAPSPWFQPWSGAPIVAGWVMAILMSVYSLAWLTTRVLLIPLLAVTEGFVRRQSTPRSRLLRASAICVAPSFVLALATAYDYNAHRELTDMQGLLLAIIALLCLLNIDLCSFSLAVPEGGIPGADPLQRPKKVESMKT